MPLPEPLVRAGAVETQRAVPFLVGMLKGRRNPDVPAGYLLKQLFIALLPLLLFAAVALLSYRVATTVEAVEDSGMEQIGADTPAVAP